MIIGIDLDNTIISYEQSFIEVAKILYPSVCFKTYDKNCIKTTLSQLSEVDWMKFQGILYSKGLQFAKPYPYVVNFLDNMVNKGVVLKIISHKTLYGHFDVEKIDLRAVALSWLKEFRIYDVVGGVENIHFFPTLEEKVEAINHIKPNYFIDDLIKIFLHDNFPVETKALLFNVAGECNSNENIKVCSSWKEIANLIDEEIYADSTKFA